MARCLREKRARKRGARGVDSELRVVRREVMAGSMVDGEAVPERAVEAIMAVVLNQFGSRKKPDLSSRFWVGMWMRIFKSQILWWGGH